MIPVSPKFYIWVKGIVLSSIYLFSELNKLNDKDSKGIGFHNLAVTWLYMALINLKLWPLSHLLTYVSEGGFCDNACFRRIHVTGKEILLFYRRALISTNHWWKLTNFSHQQRIRSPYFPNVKIHRLKLCVVQSIAGMWLDLFPKHAELHGVCKKNNWKSSLIGL